MSKPFADDPDLPPEPTPLGDESPPLPEVGPPQAERSQSRAKGDGLAHELLGSAENAAAVSLRADGDVLTVGGSQYKLLKRLGAGGMGEVFLARKLGTSGFERDVALKTVLPALAGHKKADSFLKGFVDEARLAALLNHQNICQVYDLQPLDGKGLIQVLEYIPGRSLRDVIEAARVKRASLTEAFACYVCAALADALDYAHSATDSAGRPLGVVHRDVTPHNIMISTSGTVKLLDFGIAYSALENRDATTSNMVKGKDQYYAPEQLLGAQLDGRTDEFSLALCLYELLALKRFFGRASTDTDTQLHMRIAQLTPESVEGSLAASPIDASLKAIIHHALAPNREERFATCGELGDALRIFSQRRGWLYTAVDAKKELEALFALPDSPDAEKTNPSGKRNYSSQPRRVPNNTTQLPPLTPGRTAMTPASPVDVVERSARKAAASKQAPAMSVLPMPQPASAELSKPVEAVPSQTAQRRRVQLQDELHNPKTSAKKALALPIALLVGTLLAGVGLVKFVVLSSPSAATSSAPEVVKTPEQERAEREAQERAAQPSSAPPQLAFAELPTVQPAPAVAPPPAAVPGAPAPVAVARPGAPAAKKSVDAKAVDDLLAHQYGGRPVVTPAAPVGTILSPDGTVVVSPTPQAPTAAGPRRRSLDTVVVADAPAVAAAGIHLPKGTTMTARLTTPVDASQASPASAVIAANVVVDGVVVVPKGASVVCSSSPAGARAALSCDTLNLGGRNSVTIDAVAIGADKRVGLPLPRVAPESSVGDSLKDTAINTARTAVGRVTPDGVAGDVVNGAADTAANAARGQPRSPEAHGALVPAGTVFTLFLQQPLN